MFYDFQYPLHILIRQQVVHGQADDLLGDPVCHRQVLRPRGVEPPVGRERADERVEVPASEDVVVLQLLVEVVARHAVLLSVHEDREVGVVVPHARHVLEVGDALDIPQPLAVELRHMPPCGDRPVDLPKVQQAYRRAYLVHLAVYARGHDRGLVREAEVLEVVDALLGLLVVHDERAALHGVVHLGGVEAQRGHVARVEYRFPVNLDAEGVRRVVYHLEPVLVGYLGKRHIRGQYVLVDHLRLPLIHPFVCSDAEGLLEFPLEGTQAHARLPGEVVQGAESGVVAQDHILEGLQSSAQYGV